MVYLLPAKGWCIKKVPAYNILVYNVNVSKAEEKVFLFKVVSKADKILKILSKLMQQTKTFE